MFRANKESEGGGSNKGGLDNQGNREIRRYSPVHVLFLLRLARLLRQRQEFRSVLEADNWRKKLIDKAIYSTYCDCIEHNLVKDAKALFEIDKVSEEGL